MKLRQGIKALLATAAITLLCFGSAHAAPFFISFGPVSSDVDGADFTFDLFVPSTIVGLATFRLTFDGDFDNTNENADIFLDGNYIGTVLNSNPADDPFNFANNDNPDGSPGSGDPHDGTALIDIASFIADGQMTVFIDTSNAANVTATGVSGFFLYETAAVPEPATLAAVAVGLVGTGIVARRRRCA